MVLQVPLESLERPDQGVLLAEMVLPARRVWLAPEVKEVPSARKADKVLGVRPAHLVPRVHLANLSATTQPPLLPSWRRVNPKETQRYQNRLLC